MKIGLETAKDGHKVPVIDRDGKPVHLGSMYDGRYAAKVWCDHNLLEDTENLILVGLGDVQIALEAKGRMKEHLYVFEPSSEILDRMKTTPLYKKLQKMDKVMISDDIGQIERWMNTVFNEDTFENTKVYVHPGYQYGDWNDIIDEIQKDTEKKATELIEFRQSMISIADAIVKNTLRNIPKMRGCILLSRLQKVWDYSIPFILVGAGPSLNKNVDQLREVGNKACILCLDTAYTILMDHGVRPHIVCSVDVVKPMEVFGDGKDWDIPMGVIASARPDVLDLAKGHLIWCYESNEFTRKMRGTLGGDDELFPLEYGVSSLGISMALSLGASQIVLVGMDLAFSPDRKSHAGILDEKIEDTDSKTTEGYYGGIVNTRSDWLMMKTWFERIAESDKWGRYIDATEGGAKIQGMPQMTLEKVISYLREPEEDWTEAFRKESVFLKDVEYEQIMQRYDQARDDFEKKLIPADYEDAFYGGQFDEMAAFRLVRGLMKSRPENSRKERYEAAKEALSDLYNEIQKEIKEIRDEGNDSKGI